MVDAFYGKNRKPSEIPEGFEPEHIYLDYDHTNGERLDDLKEWEGRDTDDTITVRALSDFGPGRAASRVKKMFEDRGAKVIIDPIPEKVRAKRGPKSPLNDLTDDQRKTVKNQWHSTSPPAVVFALVKGFTARPKDKYPGHDVEDHHLRSVFGPRDKKPDE